MRCNLCWCKQAKSGARALDLYVVKNFEGLLSEANVLDDRSRADAVEIRAFFVRSSLRMLRRGPMRPERLIQGLEVDRFLSVESDSTELLSSGRVYLVVLYLDMPGEQHYVAASSMELLGASATQRARCAREVAQRTQHYAMEIFQEHVRC